MDLNRSITSVNVDILKDSIPIHKKNKFTIFCMNVRSARKNFNELVCLLNVLKGDFDIVALTETWLTEESNIGYDLMGYASYHIYRNQNGGGVSIYFKDHIQINKINNLCGIYNTFESIFLSITLNNTTFNLGCIYRLIGPCRLFSDELNRLILSNTLLKNNTVLVGDFNVNLLLDPLPNSTSELVNLLNSHNYKQLITLPTRETDSTKTLIDQFWSNLNGVCETAVISYRISDHYPIAASLNLDKTPDSNPSFFYRLFNDSRVDRFHEELLTLRQETEANINLNVDTLTDIFIQKLHNIIASVFPVVRKTHKLKIAASPWITKDLLKCIRKKHKLFKLYKENKIMFASYSRFRNLLNFSIKLAKSLFYRKKLYLCNGDPKKYWKVLNNYIGK